MVDINEMNLRDYKMIEINESVFTLIKDHATIKEAFIIDELQSYMDLKDPSNPKWVTPVRVRLQEKKDWKQKASEAIIKHIMGSNLIRSKVCEKPYGDTCGYCHKCNINQKIIINAILKDLNLEDKNGRKFE